MTNLNPYLIFSGNCEEAILFYQKVFGGEIISMSRYSDAPMDFPDAKENLIMHCTLEFEGTKIMASDSGNDDKVIQGNNVHLSVNLADLDKARSFFEQLSEGGKINMPMQDTFWGSTFGMLEDRFGVYWMFNVNKETDS